MNLLDLFLVLAYLALVAFAGVPANAFSLLLLVVALIVVRLVRGETIFPARVP